MRNTKLWSSSEAEVKGWISQNMLFANEGSSGHITTKDNRKILNWHENHVKLVFTCYIIFQKFQVGTIKR